MICPNCTYPVENHPENGCVLKALIGVIRDRGQYEEAYLNEIHANTNVDNLWAKLGHIIDDLGEGLYGNEP